MRVRRGGQAVVVGTGETVGALVPARVDGDLVVAGLCDRHIVSLTTPIVSDATLAPITTASWEGREIYRRSAGLLALEAAQRVAPGTVLHLGPSIGSGQTVHVDAAAGPPDLAPRVARAMRTLQGEGARFREEVWTVEEARSHFVERGWLDAASLLRVWREPTVTLVSCGDVYALRDGPLLPAATDVAPFDVVAHPDGLLLDFGDPVRMHQPTLDGVAVDARATEIASPRFGSEMERAHRRWLARLDVTSVGGFNALCVSGRVAQVVRVSEGFHEKRISAIADAIAQRPGIRVISVAGPSSSGKTTFIKRLTVQLEVAGVHPVMISLDDYYVDRAKNPRDDAGDYDYEAFEAIDAALLRAQLAALLRGDAVRPARYDFHRGVSSPNGGDELRLGDADVLLVQGIHGLNPRLLDDAVPREARFGIFIHPATTLPFDRLSRVTSEDVRLLRRIVRDRHHRGTTAEETIARWPSVRRGDEVHIYPHRAEADVVFDSSLVYELSVLKVYAERYLLEVGEQHPSYPTAHRLRRVIDRFVAIYPDHVPPTSIAREFLGGSGFEY
jgi:uridine kinase